MAKFGTYEWLMQKRNVVSIALPVFPTPTPTPTPPVAFTVEPFIDNDGDGYSNIVELSAGTDENNPEEFPISFFNVFNNV